MIVRARTVHHVAYLASLNEILARCGTKPHTDKATFADFASLTTESKVMLEFERAPDYPLDTG